jgi:hypothetical protein
VEATVLSDLKNASTELEIFYTEHQAYPATIDCSSPESSTNTCLPKSDSSTVYTEYTPDDPVNPQSYTILASGGTGDASAYYQISSDNKTPTLVDAGLLSTSGGNPITSIQNYASYRAPTNQGTIREWSAGANAYVVDDLNAYTSTNGARNDYRDFNFPCPGNTVYNVHAAIEASATEPGGTITISLSNDGGNTFISHNTTGSLSTNDTAYHFNSWPGWNYSYSHCTSGNFVIRLTANTNNNSIRVDNLLFWYNTGVSMGGGPAI